MTKKVSCPYCKKPFGPSTSSGLRVSGDKEVNSYWPFCCERCKLMDLGKWASGQYAIPGEPVEKEEENDEEEDLD